jgi:uncharacterized NAD(P)/FAD-binding protein YdhS
MGRANHVVTIVGGSTSSAILATHILTGQNSTIDVHLVDPAAEPGWSPAHGDTHSDHILNLPAGRLSLYAEAPNDFVRWVRRHGPRLGWPRAAAANPASHLPRLLYYQYVRTALDEAAARLKSAGRARLFRHQGRVRHLEAGPVAVTLEIEGGTRVVSDTVVLAPSFRPPAVPFPVTGAGERFIADPWAENALAAIGGGDRVLIVGTGLTAVDIVAALDAHGHRGPVTAVSPVGLLPFVRGVSEPHPPMLTPADLEGGLAPAIRALRRAIANGDADWRTAIDSLRADTDKLWRGLSPGQQDRLMRHFHPFWELHRHRLPAETADMLLRWTSRGQLSVVAGRVTAVDRRAEGAEAWILRRGRRDTRPHAADWVINCGPPATVEEAPADGLTHLLLAEGLARPNRTGQGFETDRSGHLVDAAGRPLDNIFVLAQPRKGHAFEASLAASMRPQLETLSALLADQARSGRPK